MKKSILKIKEIEINEEIYPREQLSEKAIRQYVRAIANGDTFPPIYVADYKGKKILVDGRHRLNAYSLSGEEFIQAEIQSNFKNIDDIFIASIRANLNHGLRFSKRDRFKVAGRLRKINVAEEEILKLTHLRETDFKKNVLGKFRRVQLLKKYKSPLIREKGKVNDVKPILSEEENQLLTLNDLFNFLKDEKIDMSNKKIKAVVIKIRKQIRRLMK